MALVKQTLIDDLTSLIDAIDVSSGEKANTEVIAAMATAIDNYIKTATVTVVGGSSAGTFPVT